MEPFAIKQAAFITSVGLGSAYPEPSPAGMEIAMVGKSNVGKSSLINSLCNNRKLAKVSSSPGKTQLIEAYLSSGRLRHIFLLLDIRHGPTAEDKQMFQWILYYGIPFTLVATKADKLPRHKRAPGAREAARLLGAPPAALPYSSETREGRAELLEIMGNILGDHISLQNPKTTIDIDSSL